MRRDMFGQEVGRLDGVSTEATGKSEGENWEQELYSNDTAASMPSENDGKKA